jgi:NAD(P)-dependent dehydrogenase (short-subunit alcohol dehydrogenase family)
LLSWPYEADTYQCNVANGCDLGFFWQHLTYQYAKRGARLVIVARRENLLERVADRAMTKGATDVHVIAGDVTKQEECKRFVDETINKYGRCKFSTLIISFLKQDFVRRMLSTRGSI